MDQASVTIALSFGGAICLFGLLTLFLVYDDRHTTPSPVRPDTTSADLGSTTAFPVGRLRMGVVAVTFLIWSLLISEHLRARR